MLYRLRCKNQGWRQYSRFLIWPKTAGRRSGTEPRRSLIDFGRNETVPFQDLVEELIELVGPDARHFGCEAEILHIRTIAQRGTSAEKQLALAGDIPEDSHLPQDKLVAIVDHLIEETQAGV